MRAASLARFFSDRRHIPSNHGAFCARAAFVAHTSARCRACAGLGVRELGAVEVARRMKLIEDAHPDERRTLRARLSAESTCQICNGTGFTFQRHSERHQAQGTACSRA